MPAALALTVLLATSMAAADVYASRDTPASKQARGGETAFRALYEELVEINTTLSAGSCTEAVTAMKAHLLKAGYPDADLTIVVPPGRPKDGNLVALLPGMDLSAKPILLLAHIDVVEANREDWERDPFTLIEEGGFFYARGSLDDKSMAAIFTDAMIRFQQEGYAPRRGIKLALTCGEETPDVFNGLRYLIENHSDLIDAAFALNEGGGGRLRWQHGTVSSPWDRGRRKLPQNFTLETTNPGGHSSRPTPDNAIYDMAEPSRRSAHSSFRPSSTTRLATTSRGTLGSSVGQLAPT